MEAVADRSTPQAVAASVCVPALPNGPPALADLLGLREEEMRVFAPRVRLLACQKGCTVLTEGERTQSIYLVRSGRVKIFLNGANGREISLHLLGAGEYFGELGLDEGPRSASVATLEHSQFFVIPVAVFRHLVATHPQFAMSLIGKLIARTRGLLNSLGRLALLDVHGRVARLLLELAREDNGRLVVSSPPTKQDIANRVGASREMVSRVFRDLAAAGYVEMRKGSITITKDLPDHKLASARR